MVVTHFGFLEIRSVHVASPDGPPAHDCFTQSPGSRHMLLCPGKSTGIILGQTI